MQKIQSKITLFLCLAFFVLLFQTGIFTPVLAQNLHEDSLIPIWFKSNISWWQEEKITDEEIINALEFLWHKEIIKIDSEKIENPNYSYSNSSSLSNEDHKKIISNMKQEFGFWQDGSISNEDIVQTMTQLIKKGIINNLDHTQINLSAAIIDVLDQSNPNRLAQQKTQLFLEKAGYNVDVFTAKDVTVEFYKNLPSMNYNFIYIRTHSLEIPELNNATFLFTGEEYDIDKYFSEQLSGQLARGTPVFQEQSIDDDKNNQLYENKMFFMISSRFVDEQMKGNFSNSIIVIGGCESVKNADIANSFVSRGASSVIGWTNPILVGENDRAMVTLFEEILINNLEINDSIDIVMEKYGSNLHYDSALRYVHP